MIRFTSVREIQRICLFLCLAIVAATLFKSAWLSDDFFITQRTIQNFFEGRGLTWNPGERVQTYTHPLWMLVLMLCQFITREFYFTTLFLSILVTLTALFVVVQKIASNTVSAVFILMAFGLSKAFIDFSTSGLENAFMHLLLAFFFYRYFTWERARTSAGAIFSLCLFASLIVLTRPDAALLIAPALIHVFFQKPRLRTWMPALAGFLPFLFWELFSLFYYGFPIPNTAYAKLNTSIPGHALFTQGISYLLSSVDWDPLTPAIILAGVFAALGSKNGKLLAAACGISLYVAYVVKIGGDYMTGRFLTAPFFCSGLILARCAPPPKAAAQFLIIAILTAAGVSCPQPTFLASATYGEDVEFVINDKNIVDERSRYFRSTGLLNNFDFKGELRAYPLRIPRLAALKRGKYKAIPWGTIGYGPYIAGPNIHFVDYFALSDPLLSKLPVKLRAWQIGHFRREIPEGYMKSIVARKNLIKDPGIAQYYDKLSLVTRGDLSDPDRLKEIWNLNTGKYDHLLRKNET